MLCYINNKGYEFLYILPTKEEFMFYENELNLLCDTFKKARISTTIANLNSEESFNINDKSDPTTSRLIIQDVLLSEGIKGVESNTVYKVENSYSMCYLYLLLPETSTESILIIGPYVNSPITQNKMLQIGEKQGVAPKFQRVIDEYLSSLPVITENSHLFLLLDAFCEKIWSGSYFAIDINAEQNSPEILQKDGDYDELLLNMKNMEERYAAENELLNAVSLGQENKIARIFERFNQNNFEMRNTDPLRNIKNYSIIMNTLLRKAAEQGGVHPMYLDIISSQYARKIEQLPNTSAAGVLMEEMFSSYCKLVRKHSIKDFSPLIGKAIMTIESDISAELSLSNLASQLNISSSYLCSLFKKETGKTITEYIAEKRIKRAKKLLKTTNLQIQTIATHCGMPDVGYFSKLFKKQTGKTPREYRN